MDFSSIDSNITNSCLVGSGTFNTARVSQIIGKILTDLQKRVLAIHASLQFCDGDEL